MTTILDLFDLIITDVDFEDEFEDYDFYPDEIEEDDIEILHELSKYSLKRKLLLLL